MKNYEEMSDFEINKLVAISVGFKCYYGDGSYTNNHGLIGAIVSGKNNSGRMMVGEFNPCNNPSDAWPIIVDNEISINRWATSDDWATDRFGHFDTRDDKPLRAAMIVFLKMNEGKL